MHVRPGFSVALAVLVSACGGKESTNPTVSVGPAVKIAFAVQPSSVAAGTAMAPAVQVAIQDAAGNTATSATLSVTVAIDSNPAGGTLSGTKTVAAVGGVATFANLSIDKAKTGYTLTATVAGLTGVTSAAFAVTPGAAARLAWVVEPGLGLTLFGNSITPAPVVAVQDSLGNMVTGWASNVTLTVQYFHNSALPSVQHLSGDTMEAAASGVATFPNLRIDSPVSDPYELVAQTPSLAAVPSLAFHIYGFTEVSVGYSSACGILVPGDGLPSLATSTVGAPYCWGYNGTGQLGHGSTVVADSLPVGVAFPGVVPPADQAFYGVSVGNGFACASELSSLAYCWGSNDLGQLGNGTSFNSSAPGASVSAPQQFFTSVTAGGSHACGVNGGGGYCWGSNGFGQLGNNTTSSSEVAVGVLGLSFNMISAGYSHTCGVTQTLAPYCWGDNSLGQLGNDSLGTYDSIPTRVYGNLSFVSMSAGYGFSCGLTTSGGAYCWGYNDPGQNNSTVPFPVPGNHTFTSISTSRGPTSFACGVDVNGTAYCWGDNSIGELGNGSLSSSTIPVEVSGNLVFLEVSAGYTSACGIAYSGTYCWGDNGFGELGNGSALGVIGGNYSKVPVRVANPM